jgi:hypothetical protein
MSEENKNETPDESIEEAPEVVAHSAEEDSEELPWCIANGKNSA